MGSCSAGYNSSCSGERGREGEGVRAGGVYSIGEMYSISCMTVVV